ncbi:AbrB/MazE/SpoVT family DNA-binding domain-containing protein [uncultured Mailhella sp.]|uniref:AbrB/MazE/SpoVT family DNA-binding domain-containing protein n=1 Tax=uncultured Mailhella sp. TaxID=1981031 RepID=UPI0026250F7A|nr:AbrB/MazE/SpoVT family DNA-binding domain-containing protein [uncultured Mailhella sp.]
MLAKLTSKNQLTLPKAVIQQTGTPEYFEIALRDGSIVLTPVKVLNPEIIRGKMAALGISEQDIQDAVHWARSLGE